MNIYDHSDLHPEVYDEGSKMKKAVASEGLGVEEISKIAVGIVCDQDTKLKFPDRGHYNYECLESKIATRIHEAQTKYNKGGE